MKVIPADLQGSAAFRSAGESESDRLATNSSGRIFDSISGLSGLPGSNQTSGHNHGGTQQRREGEGFREKTQPSRAAQANAVYSTGSKVLAGALA